MACSLIKKAFSRTGGVGTTTPKILKYIRDFYCGENGILNLTHKHTDRSDRCNSFLDKLEGRSHNSDPTKTITKQRGGNEETRRRCRDTLLAASHQRRR